MNVKIVVNVLILVLKIVIYVSAYRVCALNAKKVAQNVIALKMHVIFVLKQSHAF